MQTKDLMQKIRTGEIDVNLHQNFFSHLIKGLLLDLSNNIKLHGKSIPHIIYSTGSDNLWIDLSLTSPTNQNVYSKIPRCGVSIGSLDVLPDQLTSPYTTGNIQFECDNKLYTLSGEFRRMPIKVNITLKYVLDTFSDALLCMQSIISTLMFLKTYKFVYCGQTISASYKIPESLDDQHNIELTGDSSETKNHIIELSIELESNFPVFDNRTMQEYIPISTNSVNLHIVEKV